VVVVAGRVKVSDEELADHGIDRAYALPARSGSLAAAMTDTPPLPRALPVRVHPVA
jgi:hypothetical protein